MGSDELIENYRSSLKDAAGNRIPLDDEVRVWLDDQITERPAPEGWVHLRTAREVCLLLLAGNVVELSLDNDLGGNDKSKEDVEGRGEVEIDLDDEEDVNVIFGRGYEVALFLDEQQGEGNYLWPRDGISIHSANSNAGDAMESTFLSQKRKFGIGVEKTLRGTKRDFMFTPPEEN